MRVIVLEWLVFEGEGIPNVEQVFYCYSECCGCCEFYYEFILVLRNGGSSYLVRILKRFRVMPESVM
jgi:hypothetical protein